MSDAAADRLTDEQPGRALATALAGPAASLSPNSSPLASSSTMEAPGTAAPTTGDLLAKDSLAGRCTAKWHRLDSATRRLSLWAMAVLAIGLFLRLGSIVQPKAASPTETFQTFIAVLEQRLPVILYGEDPFGQTSFPVDVKWEIVPSQPAGGPLKAVVFFEDATLSKAGQVLYTRFTIDYQWRGDHWICHNLKCDVERPELSKLDQMDFNAVLAHESAEKTYELVKLQRARAESLLKVNKPLGALLRSSSLY